MIVCVDLDDTITSAPDLMRAIMEGLQSEGHKVIVLSGGLTDGPAQQEDLVVKSKLLRDLGCADCYDLLFVVNGDHNITPEAKVAYMQSVGASALVDNRKENVKAARNAGIRALRYMDPKGV